MQPSVNAMKSLPNDGINDIKPTRQCGQPLVTELPRPVWEPPPSLRPELTPTPLQGDV